MAVLQSETGLASEQHWQVAGEPVMIGRHPDCQVVLDAAAVSRQHARLSCEAEDYFLEDLQSRNGTFVNGRQIQAKYRLQDGDRLKIGDQGLIFFRDAPHHIGAQSSNSLGTVSLTDEDLDANATIMTRIGAQRAVSGQRTGINPEAKLRAVLEISHHLARAVSVDQVLPSVLESLFKIFPQVDRGFVLMKVGPDGKLIPKGVKFRRENENAVVRISRTIVNQVMETQEAILSADAANDKRFDASHSIADLRIRSVMCAPLVNSEGEAVGVLQVDTFDQRQRFSTEDLDVLASVAAQAAIAIDNADLHEQSLRQQAFENDLLLAHKVQKGLLPAAPPKIGGYQFFDFYEPAHQVGGDYYDYILAPDGRLAVVLGDVSGKGVSAALVMAKLSGEVRYCLASEADPAVAVDRINAGFSRSGWDDRFVTFVLIVLDPHKHEVTIVNAGHLPPLLRSKEGQLRAIGDDEAGLPLGVDPDYRYQSVRCSLAAGEVLVLYTDGISEAMNEQGQLYGLDRLNRRVQTTTAGAPLVGRQILDDVKQFVGGRPLSDDMCLACISRES